MLAYAELVVVAFVCHFIWNSVDVDAHSRKFGEQFEISCKKSMQQTAQECRKKVLCEKYKDTPNHSAYT